MIPWYERSFGREYLELYAHRDLDEARADIRAIIKLVAPSKDTAILDLGCGAGRHLIALQEMGFTKLVGLDLSSELLKEARAALKRNSVELICGDMREIPYANRFGTVLSLFTTFGYFEKDTENEAVLRAVARSMTSGGAFLMDYLNRDHVIDNLDPEDERTLEGKRVVHRRWLSDNGQRVEKATIIISETGGEAEFHESVRLYTRDDVSSMLKKAGLTCLRHYGSLEGEDFGQESKRLIIVARKEASGK